MPRKSTASTDANGDVSMMSNATATSTTSHAHPKPPRHSSGGNKDDGLGIDDLLLPRTLVSRLARGVLPANTSLQKDATLALAKSATVFISYLAHHANEQSTKKTLGPQDVLKALGEIEMQGVMDLGVVGKDGRLGGRLEREMEVYEEAMTKKRKGYRDKKKRESGGVPEEEERGEPSSKKARRASEEGDDEDDDERMLEQQLNGGADAEDPSTSAVRKGKRKSHAGDDAEDADDGDTIAEDEEDGEDDDDANDDQDDDDDDDDDDDEEEDDGEVGDGEDGDEIDPVEETRNSASHGRGNVGLLPDGNVEIGTDDESD